MDFKAKAEAILKASKGGPILAVSPERTAYIIEEGLKDCYNQALEDAALLVQESWQNEKYRFVANETAVGMIAADILAKKVEK